MKVMMIWVGVLVSSYLLAAQDQINSGSASSEQWLLKRDEHRVQIYVREVAGSKYKAVRAVTRLQVRLESVVALLQDAGACPQWADLCSESHIYARQSDTNRLIYTRNALPWPASDRDLLARVIWSHNPATGVVTMQSDAVDHGLKRHKGCVRLTQAHTAWILTPLGQGWVEVAMEAHINPAGPLPAWLTNLLLVTSPYKTLRGLRKAVFAPRYADAHFNFIDEPHGESRVPARIR